MIKAKEYKKVTTVRAIKLVAKEADSTGTEGRPGDYMITEVNGKRRIISKRDFEEMYKPVEEAKASGSGPVSFPAPEKPKQEKEEKVKEAKNNSK